MRFRTPANRPSRNLEQSVSLLLGWRQITLYIVIPLLSPRTRNATVHGRMFAKAGSEEPQDKLSALIDEWAIVIANQREEASLAFNCLNYPRTLLACWMPE